MQTPPGTKEANENLIEAKRELIRLRKGMEMIQEAFENNEFDRLPNLLKTWTRVSENAFSKMELAILISQYQVTKNTVVIKPSGELVNIESQFNRDNVEVDPWTLQSLAMLHEIFGDDIKDFVTFKETCDKESEEKA